MYHTPSAYVDRRGGLLKFPKCLIVIVGIYLFNNLFLIAPARAEENTPDPPAGLSAWAISREIVQGSAALHAYDWRKLNSEVYLGYGYADEANNFNTESYDLGIGLPQDSGYVFTLGLRRTNVYSTPSTNQLGSTPYLQEALTTRFELYGGVAASLLEGRAISRLSPWVQDLEFALFAVGRIHLSRATEDRNPMSSKKPKVKLGQKPIISTFGLEVGFRGQIYFPLDIGIFFEAMHNRPKQGGDQLKSWASFEGGLLWAIP